MQSRVYELQTRENEGIFMQRIRNQLRIHWGWLKREEDYNEIADFIQACMSQALSIQNRNEADSRYDFCKCGRVKWKGSKRCKYCYTKNTPKGKKWWRE